MTEITKTAKAIVHTKASVNKPVIACFMGQETVATGIKILKDGGVITTTFPEPAAKALAIYSKFVDWSQTAPKSAANYSDVDKEAVAKSFAQAKEKGQTSFPEAEALEILKAYGFPVLKTARAKSSDKATQLIKKMGGKYAMKIISQDILHKSDVGGVALNVTAETAKEEYETMIKRVAKAKPKANLEGVLLMEMAPTNGVEVILGVNKAPGLGTMIMFGLGGIYVEVLKDVSFSFAPLNKVDAKRMINSLQSSQLFDGVRGQEAIDKKLLAECIGRLSQLATDFPEIVELDINPLLALPGDQGIKMLDARIVIG